MSLYAPSGTAPFADIQQDPAAARIRAAAARNTLSHALLLSGGGPLYAAARYAAAAMECTEQNPPCGACPACQKVLRDVHPDVTTVRDDQHKNLAADVVRSIRQDAYIRPNEGAKKVYLFPDCSLLTERDQNILLKVVEEGPPYAAFIFCAENPAVILQTLRSRCVELKPRPAAKKTDSGGPEHAPEGGEDLCRRVVRRCQGTRGAVAEWAVRTEKKRLAREQLEELLRWCQGAFAAALLLPYGRPPEAAYGSLPRYLAEHLQKRQLLSVLERLKTHAGECAWPVGTGHVLGALAAELEEEL